jgi:hypothetical protein
MGFIDMWKEASSRLQVVETFWKTRICKNLNSLPTLADDAMKFAREIGLWSQGVTDWANINALGNV